MLCEKNIQWQIFKILCKLANSLKLKKSFSQKPSKKKFMTNFFRYQAKKLMKCFPLSFRVDHAVNSYVECLIFTTVFI